MLSMNILAKVSQCTERQCTAVGQVGPFDSIGISKLRVWDHFYSDNNNNNGIWPRLNENDQDPLRILIT